MGLNKEIQADFVKTITALLLSKPEYRGGRHCNFNHSFSVDEVCDAAFLSNLKRWEFVGLHYHGSNQAQIRRGKANWPTVGPNS